jgi:putative methylase
VKKSELYDILESIQEFSHPKSNLEQYPTDAITAADLLFSINAEMGDSLAEKIIIDLGAGTGRLSIGSLILGAKHVFAVEIDEETINELKSNAETFELENDLTIIQGNIEGAEIITTIQNTIKDKMNIDCYSKKDVMVIMNPPFGFVKKGIDIRFLEVAMGLSSVVYSIHAAGEKNRNYIKSKVEKFGGKITHVMSQKLILRAQFDFHTKKRMSTLVDIYRIEGL